MKKMVVADFNGTLIDNEEAIPMTTVLAIDEIRNAGNLFVVATGKIPTTVLDYNKDFNFLDYVIACNGAYIYDVSREKVIFKEAILREVLREIKQSFEDSSPIYFCTPNEAYLYISTIYQEKNDKIMKSDIKYFNRFLSKYKKHIYKIEIVFSCKKDAEKKMKELNKRKLPINFNIQTYNEKNYFIEITAKGVDKFTAVEFLSHQENIKIKDVIAIGDSYNDIRMIKRVGCGIAVSNAVDEVKKVARKQTSSNNDRGVEKVLKNIL